MEEQFALWNGPAGRAWVDAADVLDVMLQPFAQVLAEAVPAGASAQVLDVGCGTGATTRALAARLGGEGRVTGIDISRPMIDLARARAGERESFICADAQRHVFEPALYDLVVSRFGVMFFDDPVEAFAKLRGASRSQGRLHFVAWRAAADNPFMTTAERAAASLLPAMPPRRPDGPGQFAFADAQRVASVLDEAGWSDVEVRALDLPCSFPVSGLDLYLSRLGPVGLLLQDADAGTRGRIVNAVREAFQRYVRGDEVRFDTACWDVSARNPG